MRWEISEEQIRKMFYKKVGLKLPPIIQKGMSKNIKTEIKMTWRQGESKNNFEFFLKCFESWIFVIWLNLEIVLLSSRPCIN